jgi:hypothetical protein
MKKVEEADIEGYSVKSKENASKRSDSTQQ